MFSARVPRHLHQLQLLLAASQSTASQHPVTAARYARCPVRYDIIASRCLIDWGHKAMHRGRGRGRRTSPCTEGKRESDGKGSKDVRRKRVHQTECLSFCNLCVRCVVTCVTSLAEREACHVTCLSPDKLCHSRLRFANIQLVTNCSCTRHASVSCHKLCTI